MQGLVSLAADAPECLSGPAGVALHGKLHPRFTGMACKQGHKQAVLQLTSVVVQ